MKKTLIFSLFTVVIFLIMPVMAVSQDALTISQEVTKTIRTGNASEMAKHFGPNVDLTLPGSEGTFSKSQSEVIIRNFFSNNPPTSFSENHQGASRDGSVYVIGTFKTRNGRTYRVYFYVKKVSETFFLHQVQFELQ